MRPAMQVFHLAQLFVRDLNQQCELNHKEKSMKRTVDVFKKVGRHFVLVLSGLTVLIIGVTVPRVLSGEGPVCACANDPCTFTMDCCVDCTQCKNNKCQ